MKFKGEDFDLTDKELEFAKNNPKLFERYLDYCDRKLTLQQSMVDLERENSRNVMIREQNDAKRIEYQQHFWENLAAAGVAGAIDYFINNGGDQK